MKEMCMVLYPLSPTWNLSITLSQAILARYKEYQVDIEKKKFKLSRLIFYRGE